MTKQLLDDEAERLNLSHMDLSELAKHFLIVLDGGTFADFVAWLSDLDGDDVIEVLYG